jgi:N-methylhydantoinase A
MDRGGALQIGPESAGAQPGPLCYGKGGTEPTVTDANLILGYLNPEYLVGGELTLDKARAESVFKTKVADPLGLSLERAAHGAHLVAAANMIRAIKAVSTERGRDVRDYALFAFGGNGPMFAGVMARQLGMRHIIIPPSPGLFSAFGLLYADVEHHHSRTFRRLTREADLDELNAAWDTLAREALERLAGEGFTAERARLRRAAAMHYQGQIYELNVPVPEGRLNRAALSALDAAFGDEHERSYGHKAGPEEPVEIVSIQVVAQGIREEAQVPDTIQSSRGEQQARPAAREAYFGPAIGWVTTPVLRRGDIDAGIDGPAIVEEYDATCVVPPHAKARVDDYGNILIELADE